MEAGDLKNLIFVIVAILAWVVKIAFERREQNARRGEANAARAKRENSGAAAQASDAASEEPDVVYGRRPLPPRYTTLAKPLPPAEPPPVPKRAAKRPPPPPQTHAGAVGEREFGGIADRQLEGRLKATAAATVLQSQAGTNARQRLGIDRMGGSRQALRAAVLWNEILGPPRAIKGPYRTPAARRRAALL